MADGSDAERAWRDAIRNDPGDFAALLAWGDALVLRGELVDARAKYLQILERKNDHPLALASVLYVDHLRSPTPQTRLTLQRYAETRPENLLAAELAARVTPWHGALPEPSEVVWQQLPALVERVTGSPQSVTMTLSHLEAPSALLVARRAVAAAGGELRIVVEHPTKPDPRVPVRPVRWRLWDDATIPEPALKASDSRGIARRVATLAATPFHADVWSRTARALVADLGVDNVGRLLAFAVHPPPPPPETSLWAWSWRVAHAVPFLLAGFASLEGGPIDGLLSLAHVRADWVAVGAAVALAERARVETTRRKAVRELLVSILRDGPDQGGWCLGWPVTNALLRLGTDDDPDLRHALVRHLATFDAQERTFAASVGRAP